MNKLKIIKSVFFSALIGIMFVTVMPNAYSEYSNRMTEAFLLPLMYAVFIFPLRRKSEGASK